MPGAPAARDALAELEAKAESVRDNIIAPSSKSVYLGKIADFVLWLFVHKPQRLDAEFLALRVDPTRPPTNQEVHQNTHSTR